MSKFGWMKRVYQNPFLGRIRRAFFHLFNLFYLPYTYSFFRSKLEHIPKETQIFLMTRGDFGTILHLLTYARSWEEQRGKTCIVVLTHRFKEASQLASLVAPKTELLCPGKMIDRLAIFLFGATRVHFHTFARVYARLVIDYPNALFIYPQPSSPRVTENYSPYIPFFDQDLQRSASTLPENFVKAYKETRYILDYRREIYEDMFDLYYRSNLSQFRISDKKLDPLKKKLNLQSPYAVFNISCRDYLISHNRKKNFHPERFEVLIDTLISRGYSVVIQGREEQPLFKKREGLIDYSRSSCCTTENDLLLYSGAEFMVTGKSGPENFAMTCNIPILGLNYVELPSMQAALKMRFFPKHIKNKKTGRYLSWKELITTPLFFDIGAKKFDDQVEYLDLEAEEMMTALEEFLSLVPKPAQDWLNYTERQSAFKKTLTPLHLDLYSIKGAPCDCYLSSPKFN